MQETPFQLTRCSWPRPVLHHGRQWLSEPQWDAPAMSVLPRPRWQVINGEQCWMLDWCDFFTADLKFHSPRSCGEMRGFHLTFEIRVYQSGLLVFWDDDGSIVRRAGQVIHCDRSAHAWKRSQIEVTAGDLLQIAHWQLDGEWAWGGRLQPNESDHGEARLQLMLAYLPSVQQRLSRGTTPPLKLFVEGSQPFRTVLSIYSLILNGYSPSQVVLYGEHQWDDSVRALFFRLLPFAEIVATAEVFRHLQSLAGMPLVVLAKSHPLALKACLTALCPPQEFCFMDDDLFVLDSVDSALQAFRESDLVFASDADYEADYLALWGSALGRTAPLPTKCINTGFFCLRNSVDARIAAQNLLRVPLERSAPWLWEQGFMASQFAAGKTTQLPSQEYFYPYCDGMPVGMLGYDYANNPCGFVTVHFGGLAQKPGDQAALALAPSILGRAAFLPSANQLEGSF